MNLKSKGKLVTCYIELPEGYDVHEIDLDTILLNELVPTESKPMSIGDYDDDGIADLMVKFSRSDVQGVLDPGDAVEITITGEFFDGLPFEGSDIIRVVNRPRK